MKELIKSQLILYIGGPIAMATGFAIGYGLGTLVSKIIEPLYYRWHKRERASALSFLRKFYTFLYERKVNNYDKN